MQNTRTNKAKLLAITSLLRQIISILLNFLSRTIFIQMLGAEYLGLNGLFTNILSILALSELGIGAAISFYLYKPIADSNQDRIKSIMHFYKLCYRFVGTFIILAGILCLPFLKYLVKFESTISINLQLVFMLYIFNTSATYFLYSYKQTLAYASQEGHKIEKYNIVFSFVSCIVDCIILCVFKNYYVYLVQKFVVILLKNLYIGAIIDKRYLYLRSKNYTKLSKVEIKSILKDVANISIYKIGSALYSATDNIIISAIIGTIVVGYYSNYSLIIAQILMVINLISNSFVAGIGNVMAKETHEKKLQIFYELDLCLYGFIFVSSLLLVQLLNPFISIWVGSVDHNYVLPFYIVCIIVFNFFLDTSILILTAFREGSGHFEIGRKAQLYGGIVNIVLSIILGKRYGLAGIFISTSICKLFITILPIVFKTAIKVFNVSSIKMMIYYLSRLLLLVVGCFIEIALSCKIPYTGIDGLIIRGLISILVSIVLFLAVYSRTDAFKSLAKRIKTEFILRR